MNKIILHGKYLGEIVAPASKSYLQRAIAISCLANGKSTISGYSPSKDVEAAMSVIKMLGASIQIHQNSLTIQGIKKFESGLLLNCGEAGLSARMFSAIAALSNNEVVITGEGSLLTRPMDMIVDALSQFGKIVKSANGKLPITLNGELTAAEATIDGAESSQLLTGLLIVLPLLENDSILHVNNPKSLPYIQMTLDILHEFGIRIEHSDFTLFKIKGNQKIIASDFEVEGDWSGAAFHLVAGAIAGSIRVKKLNSKSAQADVDILRALNKCGAKVVINENTIEVEKSELNAFQFDATQCPDLFPPVAVLAACCNGRSEIIGVSRLKNKESDRGKTLQFEFEKLGIEIEIVGDSMFISGGKVNGGKVKSHHDHRIAMALAVLGLVAQGPVEIEDAEAVEKSYPGFFVDFEKLKLT